MEHNECMHALLRTRQDFVASSEIRMGFSSRNRMEGEQAETLQNCQGSIGLWHCAYNPPQIHTQLGIYCSSPNKFSNINTRHILQLIPAPIGAASLSSIDSTSVPTLRRRVSEQ